MGINDGLCKLAGSINSVWGGGSSWIDRASKLSIDYYLIEVCPHNRTLLMGLIDLLGKYFHELIHCFLFVINQIQILNYSKILAMDTLTNESKLLFTPKTSKKPAPILVMSIAAFPNLWYAKSNQ